MDKKPRGKRRQPTAARSEPLLQSGRARLVIRCWVSRRGEKPVKEWIAGLDVNGREKVDKLLILLRELRKDLKMPHCRFLGGGLYELRDRSTGPGYRIYYEWDRDVVVILLGAGDKSSQESDIVLARRRMKDEE